MHDSHKLSAIFLIHIGSLIFKVLRCKYGTLVLIPSKKERIRMVEIVLHKLLFLIYIFLQQPDNLHVNIFAARHIFEPH